MASPDFLKKWFERGISPGQPKNVAVLTERDGQRELAIAALDEVVQDHFVGLEIIKSIGGLEKAAKVMENALPSGKITRSGDFGEILATEYVNQFTDFQVPIKRLRYKDDRSVAMRGDDVLGFLFAKKSTRVLKTESKSRVKLTAKVVEEACDGLCRHKGRPNPSTLSFISRRLREVNQHLLAEAVEQLQETEIPLDSVEHLVFTLSGNDPADILSAHASSAVKAIRRHLAGCRIEDHSALIKQVFEKACQKGRKSGNS
jgi:hypothetical protein